MRSQRLTFFTLATTLGLTLTACGGGSESASESPADDGVVTIGVVGENSTHEALQQVAEENGVTVEYVSFSDYNQPNPALSSGEIDMNWFQHPAFLADYNNNADDTITPVGSTSIYPLGLYSDEYTSLDQFQKGDTVAVPNDSINLSRGLLVLEEAGLVEFTSDTTAPTEFDIDEEKSTVSVTPVSAEQTVLSMDSVQGSIVNNDFLADAGLEADDALFQDGADSEGARAYVNLFASQEQWADDEVLQQVAGFYHDPAVLEAEANETDGTAVPLQLEQQELAEITTRYAEDLQGQSE